MQKFKRALITRITTRATDGLRSTLNVSDDTVKKLIVLSHQILNYALAPVIISSLPPLPPYEWARIFMYAILNFETDYVLCNEKLALGKNKNLPFLMIDDFKDSDFFPTNNTTSKSYLTITITNTTKAK